MGYKELEVSTLLVGVISDTHRSNVSIKYAMDKLKNCDTIIHLGDNIQDVREIGKYYSKSIVSVKGNCDFGTSVPSEIIQVYEDKKFFITHGHNYNVKYDLLDLKFRAMEIGADIVLYGHTHLSKIDFIDGIFFVNPGSASLSRDRFNSVAIVEIKEKDILPRIIKI